MFRRSNDLPRGRNIRACFAEVMISQLAASRKGVHADYASRSTRNPIARSAARKNHADGLPSCFPEESPCNVHNFSSVRSRSQRRRRVRRRRHENDWPHDGRRRQAYETVDASVSDASAQSASDASAQSTAPPECGACLGSQPIKVENPIKVVTADTDPLQIVDGSFGSSADWQELAKGPLVITDLLLALDLSNSTGYATFAVASAGKCGTKRTILAFLDDGRQPSIQGARLMIAQEKVLCGATKSGARWSGFRPYE